MTEGGRGLVEMRVNRSNMEELRRRPLQHCRVTLFSWEAGACLRDMTVIPPAILEPVWAEAGRRHARLFKAFVSMCVSDGLRID